MASDRSMQLLPATASDYRELARKRVPRQLFDYVDGGAYDEISLHENIAALQQIRLRQRVMRDVSSINLSTEVFGRRWSLPVALGPVGLIGMFARRGEVQAARAADAAGVPFCESTVSICPVEEVAAATNNPLWFQLYVMRDRGYAEGLMARATAAGCEVLVLTVDLAAVGARYRDTRNGMVESPSLPGRLRKAWDIVSHPQWLVDVGIRGKPLTFGNLEQAVPGARKPQDFKEWVDSQFDPGVTWKDIEWVRSHWDGPVVVKGVMDPEDARAAVDAGVDGIVVSNHGGRQLDGVKSSAEVLPSVVEAVAGRATVLADGGIRTGLDVVKMLSLGADACLLGRAWAFALAAAGEAGVRHVLNVIEREMLVAMALTATTDVGDLGPHTLDP